MKTDFYTKTLLTIIAACLLSIVLRCAPIIAAAHAQEQHDPIDVNITAIAGKPINKLTLGIYGEMPVKVNDMLPVKVSPER